MLITISLVPSHALDKKKKFQFTVIFLVHSLLFYNAKGNRHTKGTKAFHVWFLIDSRTLCHDQCGLTSNWCSPLGDQKHPTARVQKLGVIVTKSSPKNLLADCRLSVNRQSANRFFGELFSPSVGRQTADRWPTGFARNIGYLGMAHVWLGKPWPPV